MLLKVAAWVEEPFRGMTYAACIVVKPRLLERFELAPFRARHHRAHLVNKRNAGEGRTRNVLHVLAHLRGGVVAEELLYQQRLLLWDATDPVRRVLGALAVLHRHCVNC